MQNDFLGDISHFLDTPDKTIVFAEGFLILKGEFDFSWWNRGVLKIVEIDFSDFLNILNLHIYKCFPAFAKFDHWIVTEEMDYLISKALLFSKKMFSASGQEFHLTSNWPNILELSLGMFLWKVAFLKIYMVCGICKNCRELRQTTCSEISFIHLKLGWISWRFCLKKINLKYLWWADLVLFVNNTKSAMR